MESPDHIRIIFVLSEKYKDESEASEIMIQAYETCKQNVSNVSWVKDDEFESFDLGKTDFVIFEDFKGKNFDKLKESKCARILGPWCVAICLMEGKKIPNFPWPIYNVAMADCLITCSFLNKAQKIEIRDKIQQMGGCYSETLRSNSTHLITASVQTEKYSCAAEAGVKIMLPSWVDAVWEASLKSNVHCTDEQFNKHKVLPFYDLNFCSTGFTRIPERNELNRLVTENGGKLSGKLVLSSTDILVCKGVEGSTSEKYKAARNTPNIKCVTLDWVIDSIEKGHALPHNLYSVKKSHSTPTKGNESINPNFSVMSAIMPSGQENRTSLEETVNNSVIPNAESVRMSCIKRKSPSKDYISLLDSLDIKKAKMAGQYLDGCSVYVAGFDGEYRERLCKILNLSGATRYDDISDRVTHVIIGDKQCHDVKLIRSRSLPCALVSLGWLIESIEKKQPANEEEHLISTANLSDKSDFSSPLSKKGLKLLRSENTVTEKDISQQETLMPPPQAPEEDDVIKHYLKNTTTTAQEDTLAQLLKSNTNFSVNPSEPSAEKPPEISSMMDTTGDETTQPCDIFEGLKFVLVGFNEEEHGILKQKIESVAGDVVSKSFKGIADFAVVPVFSNSEVRQTTTGIVNDLWINECIQEETMREVLYYHKPFVLQDTTPLENCVITCSGYCSYERNFLKNLIVAMGGFCQDQFARITSVEKNVVGSTHLISSEASGKKYQAAVKWGLPVVNKDWLLECAKTGRFVAENDFLMGDAKAPERNVSTVGTPKNIASTPSTPILQKSTPILSTLTLNSSSKQNSTPLMVSTPGSSRVLTPVNRIDDASLANTPINKNLDLSDVGGSQVTPVHKILQEMRRNNLMGTPASAQNSPAIYDKYVNIKTPETPLERFCTPSQNKELRKQLQRYINQFPDFEPPKERRLSTPLSELKRKLWEKIGNNSQQMDTSESGSQLNVEVTNKEADESIGVEPLKELTQNTIENKLQGLKDALSASGGSRRSSRNFQSTAPTAIANAEIVDSQVFTVEWDYPQTASHSTRSSQLKIFMLSGIENDMRQDLVEQLESLGATVSDLSNYDPKCTHLICTKPARNEKTLSCMAAGKWILHISYVEKCVAAGKFLNEEDFEFGNPRSQGNIKLQIDRENVSRVQSMHWWRKEIARRGYGAFHDMRAIVVASKREPIVRVIEAGGGVVINMSPPFDDTVIVNATHCLLEPRSVNMEKMQEYVTLAKQGIYCVSTLYISDFLHRTAKDIRDCILPPFAKYYTRN